VAEAVQSVLDQTYPAVECIVVDDGSEDATASIAAGCGEAVRIVSQPNFGVSAARNQGAETASGRLLSFLDADDVWLPERVERLVQALRAEAGAEAVLSAIQVADESLKRGSVLRVDVPFDLRSIVLFEATVISTSSSLLMHREAFEAVGGFDVRLSTAADWALLVRLVERGSLAYLDQPLTLYRRHDLNMSRSIALMEHDMLLAYDELFDRAGRRPELRGARAPAYARLHRMLAGSYWQASDFRGFARNAAASLRRRPAELGYFASLPIRRLRRRLEP
jgi:glycosyltransferase involved in cell wall biosynthesis